MQIFSPIMLHGEDALRHSLLQNGVPFDLARCVSSFYVFVGSHCFHFVTGLYSDNIVELENGNYVIRQVDTLCMYEPPSRLLHSITIGGNACFANLVALGPFIVVLERMYETMLDSWINMFSVYDHKLKHLRKCEFRCADKKIVVFHGKVLYQSSHDTLCTFDPETMQMETVLTLDGNFLFFVWKDYVVVKTWTHRALYSKTFELIHIMKGYDGSAYFVHEHRLFRIVKDHSMEEIDPVCLEFKPFFTSPQHISVYHTVFCCGSSNLLVAFSKPFDAVYVCNIHTKKISFLCRLESGTQTFLQTAYMLSHSGYILCGVSE